MVTLDLSTWLSDWCSHFVSSGCAGLVAAWATVIILWRLFKRAGFRPASYACWQLLWIGAGMTCTCGAAALFSCFLAHWLQDYCWGSFIQIEFVWRIL